jgi:radical SAM superfamily enzyme YgiQ (UPF0313 family)
LLVLNLPNPPGRKVNRDYAGGFGTSVPLSRIRRKQSGKPCLNLSLPYSAAVAEGAGCEYKILDAQALQMSSVSLLENVKRFDPDIVFSMISLPSIYEDKRLVNAIKEELPNAVVVGCGSVCNVMPEEVLAGTKMDLVARDSFPYVNSLWLLIKSIDKSADLRKLPGFSHVKDDEVRSVPPNPPEREFVDYTPKYDVLPLREYEHIDLGRGKAAFVPILGSKGCPYPCSYCPYPVGFGRKTIFKHPKLVVDEIERLNLSGINYFAFRNQSFTLNPNWAKDVCNEITARKLDVAWFCEARVDETSKETLTEMSKAGCKRVHYGVETGDPTLIKTAKPGAHLQNAKNSFRTAREIGIFRHAHVILGLPGENSQTLEKTSEFLLELDPDSVTLNFATPYPGTGLYEIAKSNNWMITKNWRYYSSFDVVMVPPSSRPEDLYRMARRIERSLLARKYAQNLSEGLGMNTLRLVAEYYIRTAMTELNYRSHIRSFNKNILTSPKEKMRLDQHSS